MATWQHGLYLETSLAGAEVGPCAAHAKGEAGRAGAHGEVGGVWEVGGALRQLCLEWKLRPRPASRLPSLQPSTLQIFTLGSERLKIFSRSQMRRVSVPEILAKGVI